MKNRNHTNNGAAGFARAGSIQFLSSLVGALLLGASLTSASAAIQYFDSANGSAWDTSTAIWSATSAGTYNQTWGDYNGATFEGIPGAVNVAASGIYCTNINFSTSGYFLSGGMISISNGPSGTPCYIFAPAGGDGTIYSVLADAPGAAPTVRFQSTSFNNSITLGGANTFSGAAQIQAVTVNYDQLAPGGVPSSFGQGTANISLAIGSASSAIANYTGNGGGTDRRLTLNGTGNSTIKNSGFGPIYFTNTASVCAGTAGKRNLFLGGNWNSTAQPNFFSQLIDDMSGTNTTLTMNGGTWAILGSNSYSGGTVISGSTTATLLLTNDTALGHPTNGIRFSVNGTLAAINLGAAEQNDVTISGSRTITVDSTRIANFTTPDTNNLIVDAYITGAGGVQKKNSSYTLGSVRFNCDTNDFAGDFTTGFGNTEFTSVANQGTPSSLGTASGGTGTITMGPGNSATKLKYVGAGNSSTTRPLAWSNPTTICNLDASGSGTIAYLAAGNLKTGSGSAICRLQGTNTGANTLNQVINDNGGVTTLQKLDGGTWVLTGVNTFSGTTTISGGILSVSADSGLGTAPGFATPGSLTLDGGALSASASFTLDANRGIALGPNGSGALDVAAAQTLTYAGTIADSSTLGNLIKTGAGTLTLTSANTYTGDTTVSGGTLALTGSGSIGSGTNLIIDAGGTFDISALGGGHTLAAYQALLTTNGATATINGSLNAASGSVVMTNLINTPTLNVTAGTLTLDGSTPFAVDVNNGGTPLGAGSYKLISAGAGGSVAGTAPATVTVGGDGLAGGATAALSISGGELYLVVTGGSLTAPTIEGFVKSGASVVMGFSGPNGQTWKVLTSTNVTTPLASWTVLDTGTFGGSTVYYTNSTPTDPMRFYSVSSP